MHSGSDTNPTKISRPVLRDLRLRTMRVSIAEGAAALVMVGLSEAFYIPYLNALGASHLQIGLGASLPSLMSGLVQLIAPIALYKSGNRRKLIVPSIIAQALAFVPLALVWHLSQGLNIWMAIAAFVISGIFGNVIGAAWADWMSEIVPRKRRGKYFALRNRVLGVVQISIAILGGYFLDKAGGKILIMFSAIWFACCLARLVSAGLFKWYYEPPFVRHPGTKKITFLDFLGTLHATEFGLFTLATSLIGFAVNISGPFFPIHMLNNLGLNYRAYTILIVTPIAATIATLHLWGKIIDRFGSVTAIRLSALILCVLPLPWVLTSSYSTLLIVQVISGFSWSGFNLAIFTYYVGSLRPHERVSHIAYFSAVNFGCIALGAAIGGYLIPYLPQLGPWQLQSIFVLSSVVRLIPAMMFQWIKHEPYTGKMSLAERFFFDPNLTLRTDFSSFILRYFKRPF